MTEFDLIETPEMVELEQRLAGIGSRFIAGLIDNLVISGFILMALLALALAPRAGPGIEFLDPGEHLQWFLVFLISTIFLYLGYFTVFEIAANGRTLGKMAMKLRVVKEGGGPVTALDLIVRNLLRLIDSIPLVPFICAAFYLVGGVSMFVTRKFQRLGDLAAGTVVVSEGVQDYSARSDRGRRVEWQPETSPEALRATGLSPQEYRVLTNYWLRRGELALEARARLLPRLLGPILQRAGQPAEGWSVDALETYVGELLAKAVAAERQARESAAPSEKAP